MTTLLPVPARAELRRGPAGGPAAPAPSPRPASPDPADAGLEGQVQAVLCRRGYSPLRTVGVAVTAGRVVLHGRVPSFYLKQVAQEAARAVPGVSGLVNRLVVTAAS